MTNVMANGVAVAGPGWTGAAATLQDLLGEKRRRQRRAGTVAKNEPCDWRVVEDSICSPFVDATSTP